MHQKKILVIDDQKSLVWGLEKFLAEKGFDVEAAYDGVKGEEQIKSEHYDVVVMDLKLPGKSGLEILESVGRMPDTQFILISAFATAEDAEKAALLGARDFLPKPFDPEELFERISQILFEDKKEVYQKKVKWLTFPCDGPARIDMIYQDKAHFWIDAFKKHAKTEGVLIAEKMSPYEMGYISALLDTCEDVSGFESLMGKMTYQSERNKILALIDLQKRKALFITKKIKVYIVKWLIKLLSKILLVIL